MNEPGDTRVSGLPGGTVTFLFTDIDGSTLLERELRERYSEVLAEHRRLLREAFVRHGGHEIDTQGDSFFVVFPRARDAVAAAVAAQRALAEHSWPDERQVRIRIGMHTGEASLDDGRYVGFAVHRGARISAAGHGGQILLSSSTRDVVEDDLPAGQRLVDLGEKRLKDLPRPERVYQLLADGLATEFPPLKTLVEQELPEAAEAVLVPGQGRRRARRLLLAGALVSVAAALVAIAALTTRRGATPFRLAGDSVAVIDVARNVVVDEIPVGAKPVGVAVGEGSVWIVNAEDETLLRVDPQSREVIRTIGLQVRPSDVAAGAGAVWVASVDARAVLRIDPDINEVVGRIAVSGSGNVPGPFEVAAGPGGAWARHGNGLVRIDGRPRSQPVLTPADPFAWARVGNVALSEGAAWLLRAGSDGTTIVRIDPRTNAVTQTIDVDADATDIAVAAGALWIAEVGGSALKVDASRGVIVEIVPLPQSRPPGDVLRSALAGGLGAVWALTHDGLIVRIDLRTGTISRVIELDAHPIQTTVPNGNPIAVGAGAVWVAIGSQ